MRWLALCIVGGFNEQNSIVKKVRVDDWTTKKAIIASNEINLLHVNDSSRCFLIFTGWSSKSDQGTYVTTSSCLHPFNNVCQHQQPVDHVWGAWSGNWNHCDGQRRWIGPQANKTRLSTRCPVDVQLIYSTQSYYRGLFLLLRDSKLSYGN